MTKVFNLKCPGRSFTLQDFEEASYGYWLIFRHFANLNKTWCALRDKVLSGDLPAKGATCSTGRYDPSKYGAGPQTTGVVRILTGYDDYLDVGLKLIQLEEVQHDIKYKTVQSSHNGRFSHIGRIDGPVTRTTLYWNKGEPSTIQQDLSQSDLPGVHHRRIYLPSEDKWKVNIAHGLQEYSQDRIHGRWIVPFDYRSFDLTYHWHKLKYLLEKGKVPASRMECVGTTELREQPTIHVFTTEKETMRVGELILPVVKRDISYVINDHFLTWNKPAGTSEEDC